MKIRLTKRELDLNQWSRISTESGPMYLASERRVRGSVYELTYTA